MQPTASTATVDTTEIIDQIREELSELNTPLFVSKDGSFATSSEGDITKDAFVPAVPISALGDHSFCSDYSIDYPLVGGSMAKGISSEDIVIELGKAGMLGFFGAAGLTPERVNQAIDRIQAKLPDKTYGFNLIHSPAETGLEDEIVDLYLKRGIKLIEASAFLDLTLPIIRYRTAGIYQDTDGNIVTPNRIIAKVSREEVATKFFAPAPEKFLNELIQRGDLTQEQAELAKQIPVAQDITAEADSGGHTDNRPALNLFPTIVSVRDKAEATYNYPLSLRVGLGGGIATPSSASAAFAMGAAYIVTGTINQACIESGTSDVVREMLTEARQADIALAPAADMFEMGVTVQVLKRGTMFSMRGAKLFEIYKAYPSMEAIPEAERLKLEKTILKETMVNIWASTQEFFAKRDPKQLERADRDPKYKMALVFRWYLGMATHWANDGIPERKVDYQIWCGPGMGAFNEWSTGSFLAETRNRTIALVSLNILFGAAYLTRVHFLGCQGIETASLLKTSPLTNDQIKEYVR